MLDLGWSELLVIGIVALIVVGPKDLPRMLRTLGQYAGRARGIAREFQRSMDDAARQADIDELKEVKKGLDDMRDAQYKMQREMGQSFLDKPKKAEAKTPEGAKSDKTAKTASAKAVGAAAAKPAPKSAAKPAKAEAPAKPVAEPGETSGA
jgi:sec-independent protein translocase protein TatB